MLNSNRFLLKKYEEFDSCQQVWYSLKRKQPKKHQNMPKNLKKIAKRS